MLPGGEREVQPGEEGGRGQERHRAGDHETVPHGAPVRGGGGLQDTDDEGCAGQRAGRDHRVGEDRGAEEQARSHGRRPSGAAGQESRRRDHEGEGQGRGVGAPSEEGLGDARHAQAQDRGPGRDTGREEALERRVERDLQQGVGAHRDQEGRAVGGQAREQRHVRSQGVESRRIRPERGDGQQRLVRPRQPVVPHEEQCGERVQAHVRAGGYRPRDVGHEARDGRRCHQHRGPRRPRVGERLEQTETGQEGEGHQGPVEQGQAGQPPPPGHDPERRGQEGHRGPGRTHDQDAGQEQQAGEGQQATRFRGEVRRHARFYRQRLGAVIRSRA